MRATIGLLALVLSSCGGSASYDAEPTTADHKTAKEGWAMGPTRDEGAAGASAAPPMVMAPEAMEMDAARPVMRGDLVEPEPSPEPSPDDAEGKKKGENDSGGGEAVRRWFPEAFLWQPLVETDASGTATVEVQVPDSLTTWRVLALAHTRGGQQAGTVATFDSRLPLYVDPVVPGWLYAGDEVDLPVMVVNTTDAAVTAPLDVEADGALQGRASGSITVAAGDSDVRRVPITASGVGAATVRASLAGSDAAERQIPVIPVGRPVEASRGGLLAAPRHFKVPGPQGADPISQELAVLVFPGPLAVVQAEVERAAAGGGYAWDAAYGYALAAEVESLAARTGAEVDAKALRRLRILSWQRVVPFVRSPDPGVAADLLAAMRNPGDSESADTLRKRLVRVVADGQRADGTWARADMAPIQQIIAQTAFAVRTLPEDEVGARLRAAGALERFAREIKDPYTAAVVLASGVIEGDLATDVRKILLDGAVENADGVHTIEVPAEVLDPWGRHPTQAETLAWAALALAKADDVPWRGDLVSQLMSGYEGSRGFGAGPADVIALEAISTLLPGLEQTVTVTMTLDGVEVARQTLDPSQPKQPAVLLAKPAGRNPDIGLTVEPAVPGLVFVASLASWVPWTGDEAFGGVEVALEAEDFRVGHDSTITLRLSASDGVVLSVEQGLPAGATVDEQGLSDVVGVADFVVSTDRVTLHTRPFIGAEVIEIPITVTPAFAGRFSTGPLVVEAEGERVALPPLTWVVAPENAALAVR